MADRALARALVDRCARCQSQERSGCRRPQEARRAHQLAVGPYSSQTLGDQDGSGHPRQAPPGECGGSGPGLHGRRQARPANQRPPSCQIAAWPEVNYSGVSECAPASRPGCSRPSPTLSRCCRDGHGTAVRHERDGGGTEAVNREGEQIDAGESAQQSGGLKSSASPGHAADRDPLGLSRQAGPSSGHRSML